MMFHRSLWILAALAQAPTGLTSGQLVNRVGGFNFRITKGQVETCLKHLILDKYVRVEKVAHRPNMEKHIYHIKPVAIEALRAIANDYDNREKQVALPIVGEVS